MPGLLSVRVRLVAAELRAAGRPRSVLALVRRHRRRQRAGAARHSAGRVGLVAARRPVLRLVHGPGDDRCARLGAAERHGGAARCAVQRPYDGVGAGRRRAASLRHPGPVRHVRGGRLAAPRGHAGAAGPGRAGPLHAERLHRLGRRQPVPHVHEQHVPARRRQPIDGAEQRAPRALGRERARQRLVLERRAARPVPAHPSVQRLDAREHLWRQLQGVERVPGGGRPAADLGRALGRRSVQRQRAAVLPRHLRHGAQDAGADHLHLPALVHHQRPLAAAAVVVRARVVRVLRRLPERPGGDHATLAYLRAGHRREPRRVAGPLLCRRQVPGRQQVARAGARQGGRARVLEQPAGRRLDGQQDASALGAEALDGRQSHRLPGTLDRLHLALPRQVRVL